MENINDMDDRQIMSGVKLEVLDHGFVRVVDTMGDDAAIVQAARVSYGKGTKTASEDADLINYLMRHWHTSPFEMCEIKLHCKMPIFVARQWIRHRTAAVNEYSCRYSNVPDEIFVPEPERIRVQSTDNKQGSSNDGADMAVQEAFGNLLGSVHTVTSQALAYGEKHGIAREINRINMTVAHYTEWYWKISLHNLLHFLKLRLDPHAQEEIRVYAEVIARIVQAWVPATFAAFMQYRFHAVSMSVKEQEILAPIAHGLMAALAKEGNVCPPNFTAGEWREFLTKLQEIAELTDEDHTA